MAKGQPQTKSDGPSLKFEAQPGMFIDDAMGAIEVENPPLKDVLARDGSRPGLGKVRRGGLADIEADGEPCEQEMTRLRECRRLAAPRDALLPKLPSDELPVPEAEGRVTAAGARR